MAAGLNGPAAFFVAFFTDGSNLSSCKREMEQMPVEVALSQQGLPIKSEPRDLIVEYVLFSNPPLYRVTHAESGLCYEATSAIEAIGEINRALAEI